LGHILVDASKECFKLLMSEGALLHKIVLLEMCQVEVKDNKIFYLGFIEDKTFVL